jgi:hypothetical protein
LKRKPTRRSYASGVLYSKTPLTVVETSAFVARCDGRLTDSERDGVITMLAHNPEAGRVIQGTGGVRKVRIASSGRGKSGGARVIYYFYNASMPVFLLTVYAKNEQDDLSPKMKAELTKAVPILLSTYGKGPAS